MKITFKTKPVERQAFISNGDYSVYQVYNIPKITRNHCDMNAARRHNKYGMYANSDLFERMIQGAVKAKYGTFILCDKATVKESGFLHTVEIEL